MIDSDGDRDGLGSDAAACGKAVAVDADSSHTCAALDDGSVRCWGKNAQGEVGRPPASSDTCTADSMPYACIKSAIDPKVPVAVTALGLGDQHSCAIGAGKVYCWGANDSGQFGSGMNGDEYAPFEVTQRAGATVIAGGNTHTCSLASGTLSCSGGNNEGEVGNNSTANAFTPYPSRMGVPKFGVGYQDTYALTNSGDVYGWGDNASRQIDNSGMDPRTVPTQINGVSGATAVAGGQGHACALLGAGTVSCWGANDKGQLGRGTLSTTEGPGLAAISGIAAISAGADHTCARRTNKTVVCWGESYTNASQTALDIVLPSPAAQITSGAYHDCALLENGTVWCWGWNVYAQLGDGTVANAIDNTARQAVLCP